VRRARSEWCASSCRPRARECRSSSRCSTKLLAFTLSCLASWAWRGISEIIVADGGSRDASLEIARRYPEVRWLDAPRGRGPQQNAGARAASGEVLLFLHADVRLPEDAAAHIRRALADQRVVAGAFRTWTVRDEVDARSERSRMPGALLHLADLRSRYTGLPYGDQAIFVRREAFDTIGGFPEQPLFEDLELSRRLRRIGEIRTVPRASECPAGASSPTPSGRHFWSTCSRSCTASAHRPSASRAFTGIFAEGSRATETGDALVRRTAVEAPV
jgi:glycosyltransferase involved in cell wall biosynthesis